MAPKTRSFKHDGHRLVYDEYGNGERPIVLMPGLLFNRKMHQPLAEELAERGHRVLCLDLLGHGDSDRPVEMWEYSMATFGAQTLGLLDHLGIEQAVLGGTSLGGNSALEAAAHDQSRVKGLLIEMPVLDNALLGWVSQDPKPSASVLQGLFFGRVAPPTEVRRTLAPPTLVIGHDRDPIHPFSDADMLVHEMPNARIVQASSIVELRTAPERLTGEIADFVDTCWTARRIRVARAATAH